MQALFDMVNVIYAKISWCRIGSGAFPAIWTGMRRSRCWAISAWPSSCWWVRACFLPSNCGLCRCGVLGMGCGHCCGAADPKNGVSSLTAFLLSTAMRVGPGNILGVTGTISIGGPGALFWMWISAFFGMATSFVESTLSQIFKEKREDGYVGGMPFYGRKLLGDAAWAGVALSLLYIVYALLCFPAQGFNTISAVGAIASTVTGKTIATNSALYWIAFGVLLLATALISFGGIKKITKVTDRVVPVMAVIYVATVVALILGNFTRIPWFFGAVFSQAFRPQAVFGGTFGVALSQGIKRGLMSNEAGQGTSRCLRLPLRWSTPVSRAVYRRWVSFWIPSLSAH